MSQDKEREALNDDAIWELAKQKCGLLFTDVLHMNKAQMAATVRAALATQPPAVQGEPVAMVHPFGATVRLEWASVEAAHNAKPGPLFASTPSREPLTDEQIAEMYVEWSNTDRASFADLMRSVERAHGIHSREGGSNG